VNTIKKLTPFLKKNFKKSDVHIAKRVLFVGIINTIIGPIILISFDYFFSNLVKSYFSMQIIMFFFKTIMYRKIVFKEIESKKSYLVPLILVIWGYFLAILIQLINILQIYRVFLLIILLTISNGIIAIIGSRLLNSKDN